MPVGLHGDFQKIETMKPVALIFPGQGAQKVGMGRGFYESSPRVRDLFSRADAILGLDLTRTVFEGPQEKLTSTAYCQPAIFTVSLAALEVLRSSGRLDACETRFTAGLSLGEYTALAASGAFSFEEGLGLVERRSFFMEEAAREEKGAMAAVIGFDAELLKKICEEFGAEVANFNSREQIVITGRDAGVRAACEKISGAGAKAVIPLDVGGAFHSSLMRPAAGRFADELAKTRIVAPRVPVISNVDGRPVSDPEMIRRNLALQITSSVQWVASVEYMSGQGVKDFIEIGPGRVLKGLVRKINAGLAVGNIQAPEDLDSLAV